METLPVASGEALCLVYDLETATIEEVPRLVGESGLQYALETSLTQFFEVFPLHKRFKISADAWRTINEFAPTRRFVYPVGGDSFATLGSDDQRIADRLAAFCRHSNSQYGLLTAELSCARKSFSREDDHDDRQADFATVLESPWHKHGESNGVFFQSIQVDYLLEIAPAGFVESADFETDDEDDDDDEDEEFDYYNRFRKTRRLDVCALVVLPITLELEQWTTVPTSIALEKVQELVPTRFDEAALLARRILRGAVFTSRYHSTNTDAVFKAFLAISLGLNDAPLFCDLLAGTSSYEYDDDALSRAMSHFGWNAYFATVKRILRTKTFRSCVNVICLVLQDTTSDDHIQQLIEELIKVEPWSEHHKPSVALPSYALANLHPSIEELSRLLALAYRVSTDTLTKLLDKTSSRSLEYSLTIPALAHFVQGVSIYDRCPFIPTLRAIHDEIHSSLPALRNSSYASCTIPEHCDTCRQLQAFLSSTAPQMSLRQRDKAHLKHIESVVKRKVSHTSVLAITHAPPNIVLTKQTMRTHGRWSRNSVLPRWRH